MTDSLDGLIERVERCTGPYRAFDVQIGLALAGWRYVPGNNVFLDGDSRTIMDGAGNTFPDHPGAEYTYFTASIDAALALVERKLPGWSWKLVHEGGRYTFVLRDAPRLEIVAPAWVHSREQPALAIILALLRALQSIKTSETPT